MNFIRKIDGETTKKAVATTEEIIKILDGYDYDFACYVLKLTQQAIKQGATVESHKATRYILAQ